MTDPNQSTYSVFFNVMPQETKASPLIQSIDNSSPDIALPKRNTKLRLPAWLWWAVGGVVIVAVIVGGIVWFMSRSKAPAATPAPTDSTQTQTPPAPTDNPQVTTPSDWLKKYFGVEQCTEINVCGDNSDPDRDGLTNKEEFTNNTDPNNADSDSDGLADGDEVNVFGSNPLLSKTFTAGTYSDVDFIKGLYSFSTNQPFTDAEATTVKAKMQQFGLHAPTLTTLGPDVLKLYNFVDPNPQTTPTPANVDQSPEAKLDRDTQRITTIRKVGSTLLKYKANKQSFPIGTDFVKMYESIRPLVTTATNPNDPINLDRYLYGYESTNNGQGFTLTYYSETQNQLIKYTNTDATLDAAKDGNKELDEQRKTDIENLRQALLIYSAAKADSNSSKLYVFPPTTTYKTELVPTYISAIPKDPKTKQDYEYSVSDSYETFTLKTVLDAPPAGTTGYLCNQEECRAY
jgi:hypothetical protein